RASVPLGLGLGSATSSSGSTGLGNISPTKAAIRTKLEQALDPEVLELCNESGSHAVPPGGGMRFHVAVVSSLLKRLSLLQGHQLVHTAVRGWLGQSMRWPCRRGPLPVREPSGLGENEKTRGTS
uniref:Uncharacterized protein n=1 Tax=Equus caballus TaxID=9796 RepID=A0A3Q2GVF9_HORSE